MPRLLKSEEAGLSIYIPLSYNGPMPEVGEGLPENRETIEIEEWAPDVSFRPHHIFNPDVQNALQDKDTPRITRTDMMIAAGRIFEAATQKLSGGYYKDVAGESVQDALNFHFSKNDFLDRIKTLPDDAVACLDIKPDEICNSCVIGQHCTATNVRTRPWPFPIKNTEKSEAKKMDKIETLLKEKGAKEGEDYIFKDSDYVIFDFDGKALNQAKNPTPKPVNFKSMLVKLSWLRKIAA